MKPVNGYYHTPKNIEYVSITSFDMIRYAIVPRSFVSIRGDFKQYLTYATLIYPTDTRDDDTFKSLYPEYFI
jgi:hypothetical protein